jgi:hypothetical protein
MKYFWLIVSISIIFIPEICHAQEYTTEHPWWLTITDASIPKVSAGTDRSAKWRNGLPKIYDRSMGAQALERETNRRLGIIREAEGPDQVSIDAQIAAIEEKREAHKQAEQNRIRAEQKRAFAVYQVRRLAERIAERRACMRAYKITHAKEIAEFYRTHYVFANSLVVAGRHNISEFLD